MLIILYVFNPYWDALHSEDAAMALSIVQNPQEMEQLILVMFLCTDLSDILHN
jgi:hypothetical protein